MQLEQKYESMLDEVKRHGLPGVDLIRLCFRALSLAAAIDRDCAVLLEPHGLSEGRFVLLFLLDAAPRGLPPHLLAERAGVTRATVTSLVDGLVREGLAERRPAPEDRRAVSVLLTRKGKRVAARVFQSHGAWIASLFSGLTEAEARTLEALLIKVTARTVTARTRQEGAP